jgi:hypothetical protein
VVQVQIVDQPLSKKEGLGQGLRGCLFFLHPPHCGFWGAILQEGALLASREERPMAVSSSTATLSKYRLGLDLLLNTILEVVEKATNPDIEWQAVVGR